MLFLLCSCSPGCPLSSVSLIHVCVWSGPGCWWRPPTVRWALGLHGRIDHSARACSLSLSRISLSLSFSTCLSPLSLSLSLSIWLSRLSSSHCLSFSHFYISVSKTLKHFRIFWSSSVLGWWHGTSVASLSDLCPQRACSKWLRPLLQNDSLTNTLIKRAKKNAKNIPMKKAQYPQSSTHHIKTKAYTSTKVNYCKHTDMFDAYCRSACLHVLK